MSEHDPAPVSDNREQDRRVRAGGRPEYKPTDEQRVLVRKLAREGASKGAIAEKLGVSRVTLRKHFAAELGEPVERPAGLLDFNAGEAREQAPVGRPGPPAFEPSYRQREDVKLCKADNWSDERIARLIGVSRNTLLKHFATELEFGADLLRIQILRDLKAASNKGSRPAAEALLKLAGMVAPLEKLPTPDDPAADEPLGKKAKANRDAQTAHKGTSWSELLN